MTALRESQGRGWNASLPGSWSQCMRKRERGLPMSLPFRGAVPHCGIQRSFRDGRRNLPTGGTLRTRKRRERRAPCLCGSSAASVGARPRALPMDRAWAKRNRMANVDRFKAPPWGTVTPHPALSPLRGEGSPAAPGRTFEASAGRGRLVLAHRQHPAAPEGWPALRAVSLSPQRGEGRGEG
jgi:hypothetical protein